MNSESINLDLDCAVCLQKCHHPTQLPCGHIFCFLCVKGVAIQSKKCAMCRADIPLDYLDHPVLLEKLSPIQSSEQPDDYQWYYEGRNGWWKYDERSNVELERAYSAEDSDCALLLAGALYCVDFQSMVQFRRSDPTRRRKIKRDVPTLPAKGIAGIKIFENQPNNDNKDEENDSNVLEESNLNAAADHVPDTNPVTNSDLESPETNDISEVFQRFSSINLSNNGSSRSSSTEEET